MDRDSAESEQNRHKERSSNKTSIVSTFYFRIPALHVQSSNKMPVIPLEVAESLLELPGGFSFAIFNVGYKKIPTVCVCVCVLPVVNAFSLL